MPPSSSITSHPFLTPTILVVFLTFCSLLGGIAFSYGFEKKAINVLESAVVLQDKSIDKLKIAVESLTVEVRILTKEMEKHRQESERPKN